MVFTSAAYGCLVLCTFVAYWLFRPRRAQLGILLLSSCLFYGWWSIQHLVLMLGLSAIGYFGGLALEPRRTHRTLALVALILLLLSTLTYFKYAAFLCDSINTLLTWLGFPPLAPVGVSVTLPLAISFHIFQLIAYLVDVYAGRHPAEHDSLTFFSFSFFFPQLVAGPIERATELLDQLKRTPSVLTYSRLQEGLELVVYGFFLKVVLADPVGQMVDSVFVVTQFSGLSVLLGTSLFALQIYCDFYGYSLIAQGTAALFSIDLSTNFRNPYWALSPSDFWRRWHITLSTWIRDYVYIPLGGNKGSPARVSLTLLLTMALAGLWHGASWNFVLWGIWHGLVLLAGRAIAATASLERGWLGRAFSIPLTFVGVFVGWFLFRASSVDVLSAAVRALASWNLFPVHEAQFRALLCSWTILLTLEYCQRKCRELTPFGIVSPVLRPCFVGCLMFFIVTMWSPTPVTFIYFQF